MCILYASPCFRQPKFNSIWMARRCSAMEIMLYLRLCHMVSNQNFTASGYWCDEWIAFMCDINKLDLKLEFLSTISANIWISKTVEGGCSAESLRRRHTLVCNIFIVSDLIVIDYISSACFGHNILESKGGSIDYSQVYFSSSNFCRIQSGWTPNNMQSNRIGNMSSL